MIITNKQFPNYKKYEMMFEGRPLSMEVGKLAELCNASVLVKYGETTVLVTCTASPPPRTALTTSPLPWTSMRSSTPSAASPAASCAVRVSPACPQCWPPA